MNKDEETKIFFLLYKFNRFMLPLIKHESIFLSVQRQIYWYIHMYDILWSRKTQMVDQNCFVEVHITYSTVRFKSIQCIKLILQKTHEPRIDLFVGFLVFSLIGDHYLTWISRGFY
jgi:hypothetical protein